MSAPALPVCWCGDPGTYALDAYHPAGTSILEDRWEWTRPDRPAVEVVTRCRTHAGPFAAEIVAGDLVPLHRHPLGDDLAWGHA